MKPKKSNLILCGVRLWREVSSLFLLSVFLLCAAARLFAQDWQPDSLDRWCGYPYIDTVNYKTFPPTPVPREPALWEPKNGKMFHGIAVSNQGWVRYKIDLYASIVGKRPSIAQIFYYTDNAADDWSWWRWVDTIYACGAIPLVKFATGPYPTKLATFWNPDSMINGKHDVYFTNMALHIKAYGKPLFLCINWEEEGSWYPYSAVQDSLDAAGNAVPL
jgi:hypothetical protein